MSKLTCEERKKIFQSVNIINESTQQITDTKIRLDNLEIETKAKINATCKAQISLQTALKQKQNDIELQQLHNRYQQLNFKQMFMQSTSQKFRNISSEWEQLKQSFNSKKSRQKFKHNSLNKIVNLLNKFPNLKAKLDVQRGHGSHKLLKINNKTVTLSKNIKNGQFISTLKSIVDFFLTKDFDDIQKSMKDLHSQINKNEIQKKKATISIKN
eukprot:209476_1